MRKFIWLLALLLLSSPAYAITESGSNDAASTVLYGKTSGGALVPIKVDADGIVDTAGGISGLTTTYVPKATSATAIGDSAISDTSGLIGINKTTSTSDLDILELNSFDLVYSFNGVSTYTNNTSESKTTFGTAFTALFDNTQYLYLGKSTTFQNINVAVRQFTTAANTLNAEYWNGSAWTTLSITDNTSNLQNSGTITYTVPGSWATTAVNGQTYYWIRLFLTNTPSTAPTIYNIRPGSNQTLSVYSSISDTTPTFQVKNDGNILSNSVSVSTPVTYVVGLATSRGGRRVDYMCTGAKDQVCINAAITACGANPCKIVLLEGTYNLTGSITPLKSNLEIAGQGMGLTKIVMSNTTVAIFSDTTTGSVGSPLTNVIFHDFQTDRTADTLDANVSRKSFFIKYMRRVQIYNVYSTGGGGSCMGIDFLDGGYISNNRLENCGTSTATTGSSGIGIGTGGSASEPVIITGNVITGSGYAGVLLEDQTVSVETNNFIVSNNIITGGSQYGIVDRGVSNVILQGNIVRSNTKDGVLLDNYGNGIINNVLISSNIIDDNTLYGINISDASATRIKVFSNDLSGNGQGTLTSNMSDPNELMRFGNTLDPNSFIQTSDSLTSTKTTNVGWSNQSAANQACETTCSHAAVTGFDTTAGVYTMVATTDATADICLCAGAN